MIKELLTGSYILAKELTKEKFFEELDELKGKSVSIHVEGEISALPYTESFSYYTYEDVNSFYEWLSIEDDDRPDEYILRLNLDTCSNFYKDELTGLIRTVTENGSIIQFEGSY